MNMRRAFIVGAIVLIFFLAMYSWNRRYGVMDDLASNVGLEISGVVLRPLRAAQDLLGGFWDKYFNLVGVREENLRMRKRLEELETQLLAQGEDLAELRRLRELVQLPVDVRWRPLAARVLAGRMGPNAVLDSVTISRGYVTGARPGVPIVTNKGLIGRVLRSSPHASTVLLITDPGSRVAVFGQESRASGILKGQGLGQNLEVDFVQRDAIMKNGEILVTSGLDNKYPKGLPVARVNAVAPSDYTQFMAVSASPLVDLQHLEEVLLLEKSGVTPPPDEPVAPPAVFVGPPLPPAMARSRAPRGPAALAGNGAAQSNAPAAAGVGAESRNAAPVPRTAQPRSGTPADASQSPRFRVITP